MYYVDLFKDDRCFMHTPFESKDAAIRYFNDRIDDRVNVFDFMKFDRIEISNDNTVLFDYEVFYV